MGAHNEETETQASLWLPTSDVSQTKLGFCINTHDLLNLKSLKPSRMLKNTHSTHLSSTDSSDGRDLLRSLDTSALVQANGQRCLGQ